MLILTQSDELNTTSEDNRLPLDSITNKNSASSDNARKNRPSSRENSLFLTDQDNSTVREKPKAPDLMGSTSTSWQESPTFKETRATIISTGPRTITRTSAVSTADPLWLQNTRQYGKERSRSSEIQAGRMGSTSDENSSFNQKQSNKRRPCRLVRHLERNIQKQRLAEDGEEKKDEEGIVEGSSQFLTSLEEERARMSSARSVQSTTDLNPTSTITAWEAGWNVTNAIQVRESLCMDILYIHKTL